MIRTINVQANELKLKSVIKAKLKIKNGLK